MSHDDSQPEPEDREYADGVPLLGAEPLMQAEPTIALRDHRLARAGVFAWSLIGLAIVLMGIVTLLGVLKLVVVPLVIALLPAALLSPISERAKARGIPPALVAGVLVVTFFLGLLGTIGVLGWLIANELTDLFATMEDAYADITAWIEGRFDVDAPSADELLASVEEWAQGLDASARAQTYLSTTFEFVSGILLLLIALFFYLKDGDRIAQFVLDLTPARLRDDMSEIGRRLWSTIGGYFRGQLLVAFFDAVFIGIGLVILGVPLALPLTILVFFGGLFPIVGAFAAGAVAALIALADGGIGVALAVVAVNVVVQQAEGNLLEPLIVGRATQLHPLAILAALTAGGFTLGILGAFLAVPTLACVVRVAGYVLEKDSERAIEPADY